MNKTSVGNYSELVSTANLLPIFKHLRASLPLAGYLIGLSSAERVEKVCLIHKFVQLYILIGPNSMTGNTMDTTYLGGAWRRLADLTNLL